MNYQEIILRVSDLCKNETNFEQRVETLQNLIGDWTVDKLKHHLGHVGVIPEIFKHDSAEEKLYAKYCDILIHAFFQLYGMQADLIKERGDFPDVKETLPKRYKIIADAKAFRLSRTALNPKDYKIAPLSTWREKTTADYACLVASFFPKERSRLFQEAVTHNVIILSYAHLLFIISNDDWNSIDLEGLWKLPTSLPRGHVNSTIYWQAVDNWLTNSLPSGNLEEIKKTYRKNLLLEAKLQLTILENEKKKINNMSREKLAELVSQDIDSKIYQINVKMRDLSNITSL